MTPEQAVTVVARHLLNQYAESVAGGLPVALERTDYPEISEIDWDWVTCRLADLAPHHSRVEFDTAYKMLASRAGSTQGNQSEPRP